MAEIPGRLVDQPFGEFAVSGDGGRVARCRLAPSTYITRQTHRVTEVGVRVGDQVEVVADHREGGSRCVALTIYLHPPDAAKVRSGVALMLPPQRFFLDNLFPRGNLTFAGVVQVLEPKRLVLRTRSGVEYAFQVRSDTVFSTGGKVVEAQTLPVQTRVFVRAGKNFDGEMDAYQVTWGDILNPARDYTRRPSTQ